MAITIEHVLTKMEQQLAYARQTKGEQQRVHLHKIQVLCELVLEQNDSSSSTLEKVTFPKAVTHEQKVEIHNQGDSLLDF
ncbi:MAG: DUF5327 family protein [Bacillaceae bacterium]